MSDIRLDEPHIVPLKNKRNTKTSYKKPKLDLKRFTKETGLHLNVVKGNSISKNRYKDFTQEEKDKRKAQVMSRRHSNPRVQKQESRQQLLRRAKQLNLSKRCSQCNQIKLYPEFDRRWDKRLSRLTLRSYCKTCRSAMNREHYLKRKAKNDS